MLLTCLCPQAPTVAQMAWGVYRTTSATSSHCRTSCLCSSSLRTSSFIIWVELLTSDIVFARGLSRDFFMNPCAVALVTGAYAMCSRLHAFTPSLRLPFLTNRCGVPSVRTVNRYLANLTSSRASPHHPRCDASMSNFSLLFLRDPLQDVSRVLVVSSTLKVRHLELSEKFMRSVPLKLSGIISLLSVNFTYPLIFPPARIWASAACRRSPAWSKCCRISSIRSVNITMRASCAATGRAAAVTSSTVDVVQLCVIVQLDHAFPTVPGTDAPLSCVMNLERFCFLSQVKDRSESGW